MLVPVIILGVLLLVFVLLAAMFGASWVSQKHNRISDIRENADEDVDHLRELGLVHWAQAIRHFVNGKIAKGLQEIRFARKIWRDPAQRAAFEQTLRNNLVRMAAKDDKQWQEVTVLVAQLDAARNYEKQGEAAAAALAPLSLPPHVVISVAPPAGSTVTAAPGPAASVIPAAPATAAA